MFEEVDTTCATAATAAVQTHAILRNTVNAKADQTFGIAGFKGGDNALAPFGFVLYAALIVAVNPGVA